MNYFAVIILEISIALQNIYFEEYVSVAAPEGCWVVRIFILRELQGVILISSTFSVNFSVNQLKLFSHFLQAASLRFLSVIPNSDLHNRANFKEVVNYRDALQ